MILRFCSPTGNPDNTGIDKNNPWDIRTLLAWLNRFAMDAGSMRQVTASGATVGQTMTLTIPSVPDSLTISAGDSAGYIQNQIEIKKATIPEWDSVFVAGDSLVNGGPLYIVSKYAMITTANVNITGYTESVPTATASVVGAVQAGTYDITADQELHLLGGSIAQNKPALLIGFKDNIALVDGYPVSDLDPHGGSILGVPGYYMPVSKRVKQIAASGYESLTNYPRINGQGGTFTDGLFDVRFSEFIQFKNIHIDNAGSVLVKAVADVADDPAYEYQECKNLSLIECTFTRGANGVIWQGDQLLIENTVIIGCTLPTLVLKKDKSTCRVLGSFIDATGTTGSRIKSDCNLIMTNTIVLNGDRLVQGTQGSNRIFDSCTLIGQTDCITQTYADSYTVLHNCIVKLADGATAVFTDDGASGLIEERNNVYHSNTKHSTRNPGGTIPLTDFQIAGTLEMAMDRESEIANVLFVDFANYNFTPAFAVGKGKGAIDMPGAADTVFVQG